MSALLTKAGEAIVTNRIIGAGTEPKYLGWGTGTNGAAATDTALQTASSEARTAGTGSQVTVTDTNDTHQVAGTIASTQSQAVTELGVFDASTSGNLYVRAVFAALNLVNGDSVVFTVKTSYIHG